MRGGLAWTGHGTAGTAAHEKQWQTDPARCWDGAMQHEPTEAAGPGPFEVDRGAYEDASTPWADATWRAAACGWIEDRLADRGLRTAAVKRVRLRPWSVLIRVSVGGGGTVWFKANPPAGAFEAPLGAALARWVPVHVLEPIAVDAERGWSLLPHGGEPFRDLLDRGAAGPGAWEELLRQYAAVQRDLTPYARDMELLGVPGARTAALPGVFDRLLAENPALPSAERGKLAALRPRLVEWCAELAAVGIADSLDHADLHDRQVFRTRHGRFVFFDWGDASVSHPFCSLPVPVGRACDRYGPQMLPRLRDAYLEPWTGAGRTAVELRRAARLAWRLAALGRACSWGRLFPAPSAAPATGVAESTRWLLELLTEPPL
ncbi:phosphotransferase [Streptomyces daqingensis]|uniref:Phosphotransferase n=2 Tax=Streptomyces daqingensis TaxID=1472640 RepID=A0ABQ2LTB6_9ACTN|nr:phosphotransferase [Streptomyces daqingensis]